MQQRRTLTGLVNGLPIGISDGDPAVVVHTLDAAPNGDNNGRPYTHDVTLIAQNSDKDTDTSIVVVFTPPTGSPITWEKILPQGGVPVVILDEAPLGGPSAAPNGGATISVQTAKAADNTVNVWGWFVAN